MLYGIHTARALANFRLSGRAVAPALIRALAQVRKPALANRELGFLGAEEGDAIGQACGEISPAASPRRCGRCPAGRGRDLANMNVNEVLANRAGELLGGGARQLRPRRTARPRQPAPVHQRRLPTALKVAAIGLRRWSAAHRRPAGRLPGQGKEFAGIVKIGRTQLQDACR